MRKTLMSALLAISLLGCGEQGHLWKVHCQVWGSDRELKYDNTVTFCGDEDWERARTSWETVQQQCDDALTAYPGLECSCWIRPDRESACGG